MTHIEKRYGLHEHRDGSPTDRSWGSGGGQEPGVSQVAVPRTGTAAIERLLPEPPPSQAAATHPVQNGRLKDVSLVPCTLEGIPGTSAELNLGTRGTGPSPGLPSQEANGQPTKLDTSGQQVRRHDQGCAGLWWIHLTVPTLGNMDMIHLLFPLNTSPSLRTLYHQKQGVCEANLPELEIR